MYPIYFAFIYISISNKLLSNRNEKKKKDYTEMMVYDLTDKRHDHTKILFFRSRT